MSCLSTAQSTSKRSLMSDLLASPPPLDNLALIHPTVENRIHQHRHLPTNCSAYLTYQKHDHQNPLLLPNKIESYFYNRPVLTRKLKPSSALPSRSILYTNNTNLAALPLEKARTTNTFSQYKWEEIPFFFGILGTFFTYRVFIKYCLFFQ